MSSKHKINPKLNIGIRPNIENYSKKKSKDTKSNKTSHYYSEHQDSELRLDTVYAKLRDRNFKFITASGVFSVKRVDLGTSILVDNIIIEEGWDVLDLGCGYGVVGIVVKRCYPLCNVDMVDVNRRAIEIAKINLKDNNMRCNCYFSDGYSKVKKKFNTIITNPPINAGRQLCYSLIEGAKDYLVDGGILQLVARHNKGGKMLELKMKEVFGNSKQIVKQSGFRVYVSEKE